MAALAIAFAGFEKGFSLGFVGNGAMNLEACRVLTALLSPASIVLRGSPHRRAHNLALFEQVSACPVTVDTTDDGCLLAQSMVVISCTSNSDPDAALSYHLLSDVPLIIVQDGNAGGILFSDPIPVLYTDHPEQSAAHWQDEFGALPLPRLHDLFALNEHNGPALVSLYGAAYFDALLAYSTDRELCATE
jgi:hypothetical protein